MKLKYKSLITKSNIDHCLSFARQEDERKALFRLLSKLDIKLSNPYKIGTDIEYKIWIINKFTKKRVYILEDYGKGFNKKPTLADAMERLRCTLDVPDSFEEYCDIVVGADEDNPSDLHDYNEHRIRADRLSKVLTKEEITAVPDMRIMNELDFNDLEIAEKDIGNKIRAHNLRRQQKHGAVIIRVDNVDDYNKVKDYDNSLRHHEKLMKQYGYDESIGDFNYKLLPVPRSDKHLEGIKKDINEYIKLRKEYDDYVIYLAKKYDANIEEEELSTRVVILHEPNSPINSNKQDRQ